MGRGAGKISAAIAAGGEDDHMRAKSMQCALIEVPRDDAAAGALFVHDEIKGEILDEKLGIVQHALLIERVDDRVTGSVGGGAGSHRRVAFAVILHMPAKRPLVDSAVLGPRERYPEMPEPD